MLPEGLRGREAAGGTRHLVNPSGNEERPLDTCVSRGLHSLATPTGLEPAASAVTGRRANQLRYGASMLL